MLRSLRSLRSRHRATSLHAMEELQATRPFLATQAGRHGLDRFGRDATQYVTVFVRALH